jgi:hypothetical protein
MGFVDSTVARYVYKTSMVEVSITELESSMMKMLKSLISSRYLKMLVFTRK